MSVHNLRIRTRVFLATVILALCAPLTWAGGAAANLSKADRLELWSDSIAVIEQLGSDSTPKSGLTTESPIPRDPRLRQWFDEYREQFAAHLDRKAEDYARYVELGKKHLEKKEITEALIVANRALKNSPDEKALLASDWIQRLARAAVAKADTHRDETEWRKAYELYYNLASLFEDDNEYEKVRQEYLTYARLDAVYKEDRKWEERLEDIVKRNAIDALNRIDKWFVEEADFQEITQAGFENLRLICDSKVMRETFPDLADEDYRVSFCNRLGTLLKRVRNSSTLTVRDAMAYFKRALEINEDTVQLPEALMVYEFMAGALDPLDDFTSMIWPVEFREFDKHTRGDFVGVGISITGGGDRPINVVSPLEDSPALRAGILPDDKITHVNGEPLEGISLTKAVTMITGPIKTDVTLTIYRESEGRSFDVVLKRDKIEIQSVKGVQRHPEDLEKWDYLIDREMAIGYVRVASFQDNTADQLREAVNQAIDDGAKGLILDLRFNPGGLLKSAIDITRLFQTRREEVVSTRGMRDRPWAPPPAEVDGPFTALPLVILANQYSASASEIVCGALQDNERAVIVGERTFGKFSVQKLMELGGSTAYLKLTTARYYLPLGRSLHHEEGATEWGVAPNLQVKLVPKELLRIRQMQSVRDVLAKAPKTTTDDSVDDSEKPAPSNDSDSTKDDHTADAGGGADGDDVTAHANAAADAGTSADADTDAEGNGVADADDADDDDEDALNLEPDPNEVPDVDLQLDTAVLLMRLHLLGEGALQLASGEDAPLTKEKVHRP